RRTRTWTCATWTIFDEPQQARSPRTGGGLNRHAAPGRRRAPGNSARIILARRPRMNRRGFFKRGVHLAAASALAVHNGAAWAQGKVARTGGVKLKLGLNAYCFDRPLRAGEMTLEDVVVYCAQNGIDALDATGYYFPGYPKTPDDDTIRNLKKKAHLNGVTLCGTGVRNDFALPDAARRQQEVQLVKDWTVVAAKLGAPVIRVFSGAKAPEGHTFDSVLRWMAADFKECAAWGRQHGVILGLQNHNDFLKTADQTIQLVK